MICCIMGPDSTGDRVAGMNKSDSALETKTLMFSRLNYSAVVPSIIQTHWT